jgi:hypothetical protein
MMGKKVAAGYSSRRETLRRPEGRLMNTADVGAENVRSRSMIVKKVAEGQGRSRA